jgi:septation ring formation regulator EzrA
LIKELLSWSIIPCKKIFRELGWNEGIFKQNLRRLITNRPSLGKKIKKAEQRYSSVIEHLPSMHKALGSIQSMEKKKPNSYTSCRVDRIADGRSGLQEWKRKKMGK